MNKSDEELMREFQHGNDTAFATLYNRYRLPIYRFLARKLNNVMRAEDLTQEVFVSIVQHAKDWREEALVKTYFYKIAFNKAISELRRSEYKIMVAESSNSDDEFPRKEAICSNESPLENYEKEERAKWIRQALQKIDTDFRDAIILKEYENLKYEEIAEILNVAIGTVKSRIFRGKMELKRLLEPVLQGRMKLTELKDN